MTEANPFDWIKLLSEFGPCAFFVFMFFIGLRIARKNAGLTPEQQRIQNVAFSVVWVSVFVFAILSVLIYWKLTFYVEPQIHGFIRNFQDPEVINTRDNLFLKRHYGAYSDYDYEFLILHPQSEDAYVTFLLEKTPDDRHPLTYRLPLRPEFYKGIVNIKYNRVSGDMDLAYGSEHAELEKIVLAAEEPTNIDIPLLIESLDATDPIIRENARAALASVGTSVVPYLVAAFNNSRSSPGLRLEVLRTLNAMPRLEASDLADDASCSLARATAGSDPDVGSQLSMLMKKGVISEASCDSKGAALHNQMMNCTAPVTMLERTYVPFPDSRFGGGLFIYVGDIRRTAITGKPSQLYVVVGPRALPHPEAATGPIELSPGEFRAIHPADSYPLSFSDEGASVAFKYLGENYRLKVKAIHHIVGPGKQKVDIEVCPG